MDYEVALSKIQDFLLEVDSSKVLDKIVEFLYQSFDTYSWVGIYIVKGENLILGPWRGRQATEHTSIPIGSGICGSAAQTGKTEIVADVSKDTRYLACFLSTKSEIVVPIKKNDLIIGEIDIDSDTPDAFSSQDKEFLEKIADMIHDHIR
jgi:putative methionine-R-sulfoxide reductase with GAF domain